MNDKVRAELECITNKLIRGNITPIVFDLLSKERKEEDANIRTEYTARSLDNSGRTIEGLLRRSKRV